MCGGAGGASVHRSLTCKSRSILCVRMFHSRTDPSKEHVASTLTSDGLKAAAKTVSVCAVRPKICHILRPTSSVPTEPETNAPSL